MDQELLQEYNRFLFHDRNRVTKLKHKIRQLAVLRLLAFLLALFSLFFLPRVSPWLAYTLAGICVVLFFYWIKVFLKKEKEKAFYARLAEINKNEICALNEDYSPFDDGNEFTSPHHPFTFDLDIFGEGSVFQFINRTTTQLGKKKLAGYLSEPETDIPTLKNKQEALLELAKYTRWRQYFAAKGNTKDEQDLQLLRQFAAHEGIRKPQIIMWLVRILPVISSSFLVLSILGILPWTYFVLAAFINLTALYNYRHTVTSFYERFGNQTKVLANYRELLLLMEQKEFETELLRALKDQLLSHEKKASRIISDLLNVMARFDYRVNFAFTIFAQPLFVWDLICIYQLDRWQKKYGQNIHHWFEVIAEFDALSSLANLNHNHPEWTLPKFEDGDFHLTANELKHPLIKSSKNIGNDFRMNGSGQITLITGANMAGKSTFLRTVGVNMVLAMNGCRAYASWLGIKPVGLFTNMRTTDNLQHDESYFFAELQRLKAILDEIKSGKEVFVIIDEMLKGTNSEDKLSGSVKVIEKLISLGAVGMVATHDLKLTEMAGKYPQNVVNKCFEIQLKGDDLLFDYKLTDGVTSTMNANFLMKKMGIIS